MQRRRLSELKKTSASLAQANISQGVASDTISISVAGDPVLAHKTDTVASALFAAGSTALSRSLKYHRPRSFFCLSGHCGGCLMRIGGKPNERACQVMCKEGLAVETQNAWPSAENDLLGAVDWLFPKGMDHHHMFTQLRPVNALMQRMVRPLAGLGHLPDLPKSSVLPAIKNLRTDVLVVGAGPAGLSAALEAANAGLQVICCDDQPQAGGSLLTTCKLSVEAKALPKHALENGVAIFEGAPMIAYFPEDLGGVAAIQSSDALLLVQANTTIYATGAYDQNLLCENNDRPGVIAGRAALRLLLSHKILPGLRVAVVGAADYAIELTELLRENGAEVEVIPDTKSVRKIRGGRWVTGCDIATGSDAHKTVRCDLVAVCEIPAPSSEPARQQGAQIRFETDAGGFVIERDANGQTAVPGVFACGDVTGYRGVQAALSDGITVGKAAVQFVKRSVGQ